MGNKTSSPQPKIKTNMNIIKPKLHTFSIKLSDGTFKKIKAHKVKYAYNKCVIIISFSKNEKICFVCINPISIETIK